MCVCVTIAVSVVPVYIQYVAMYCIHVHVLCHCMLVYVNQSTNTVFSPSLLPFSIGTV